MFVRLLFIAALIAGAFWLWRRWQAPKTAAKPTPEPAPMVRCAHCRTHVPQDQALADQDLWYCSQAHQLLGPKAR